MNWLFLALIHSKLDNLMNLELIYGTNKNQQMVYQKINIRIINWFSSNKNQTTNQVLRKNSIKCPKEKLLNYIFSFLILKFKRI